MIHLFVLTLLLGSVLSQVPSGSYCAFDSDLSLRVGATILDSLHIKLVVSVTGNNFGCLSEDYKYDTASKGIIFPNIQADTDCLGKLMTDNLIDKSTLKVTYDPAKNTIDAQADGLELTLTTKACAGSLVGYQARNELKGSYCGSNDALIGKATVVVENSIIAIAGKANGEIFSCPNEKYFVTNDNRVVLPGAFEKTDCLGGILESNDVDPNSLSVFYNPDDDSAIVKGPSGFTFALQSCDGHPSKIDAAKQQISEQYHHSSRKIAAIPSGSYCGSYTEIVQANITVLSLDFVKLVASVFGSTVTCPKEAVKYNNGTHEVTFPMIQNADDCLGSTLGNFGIDGTQLHVDYDEATNTVVVILSSLDVKIVFSKCNPSSFPYENILTKNKYQ